MKAAEIAQVAGDLVGGDRERTHGSKLENFSRIATMWNAWLAIRRNPAAPLSPEDVGHMMGLMKQARTQHGEFNLDDHIDSVGYACCTAEIASERETQPGSVTDLPLGYGL